MLWSAMLGCALMIGCDSKNETPTGADATNPQATEAASDNMKDKTEDASERAKDSAEEASGAMKDQAESASDALKKNADSAAEAANNNAAAADAQAKLSSVMDLIRDKKWDAADAALKSLEANKASLPAATQTGIDQAHKMLDAGKAGAAAAPAAATPAAPAATPAAQ
jgi:hypothetical protein